MLSAFSFLALQKEDCRLGNVFEGAAWVANQWQNWVSTSARISAKTDSGISGRELMITGGNPVSDPANTGRDEMALLLGVNFLATEGWVKNQRLALEVGMPVYEKVDGVQMSQDWTARSVGKQPFNTFGNTGLISLYN